VADANSVTPSYFLLIDLIAQTFSESVQKPPKYLPLPQQPSHRFS
jgi:hypothetical protein